MSPERKGFNVSQEAWRGDKRDKKRSSLTPITHVQLPYCIVLNRLFGSFQCSKRSKTRDMHGGWQGFASTSQPTHTGCSNWEPWEQGWGSNGVHEKWEAWATEISDSEAVQPSIST